MGGLTVGLYFARWPDRVSLLIDAADEKQAATRAAELGDGAAPADVFALAPGLFCAEVEIADPADEEEEDEEPCAILPLEHVTDVLAVLEYGGTRGTATATAPEQCGASADYGDPPRVVWCHREPHADGEHEADVGAGDLVTW